jgi:hypothetical protein
VVRTQGIDRDEDHRRAREASRGGVAPGGGVAPAGGRQKRGRDYRATEANHERAAGLAVGSRRGEVHIGDAIHRRSEDVVVPVREALVGALETAVPLAVPVGPARHLGETLLLGHGAGLGARYLFI